MVFAQPKGKVGLGSQLELSEQAITFDSFVLSTVECEIWTRHEHVRTKEKSSGVRLDDHCGACRNAWRRSRPMLVVDQ